MRLEFYSEEKLKKEILDIIGKYLDIGEYAVFFFGSRVSGKGSEKSDIDVGIEGDEAVPRHIMLDIREDVQKISTLYSIEIVDFKQVSQEFYDVAKQKIELINNRKEQIK